MAISNNKIHKAVRFLKQGKIVAYPTDTSYGLAADATNLRAVKKLYRMKGRNFQKPVHVVAASLAMAKKIAKFDKRAEKIFKKFLPGALTMVLNLEPGILNLGSWKILTAGTGKIGMRMPKNKVAMDLVRKLGRPITATSTNLSGKPAIYSAKEIQEQFEERRLKPDLIIDAGRLAKVSPSTVLDLTGGRVKILRQGPISLKEINHYLSSQT